MKVTDEPLAEKPPRVRQLGDHWIKRGEHCYPTGPIEEALRQHPAVTDVAVVQQAYTGLCLAYIVASGLGLISIPNRAKNFGRFLTRVGFPDCVRVDRYHVVTELPVKDGSVDREKLASHSNPKQRRRKDVPVPRIRNPLAIFTVEGVIVDLLRGAQFGRGASGRITLAYLAGTATRPTEIRIVVRQALMAKLRIGLHIIVQGVFMQNGKLRATSWEQKTDLRTRIPLDQTVDLLDSLHN